MDFKKENKHMVDILFVISLFCVFAFSALMLVIIGADVYKKTVSNMDNNYSTRTAFAYISEKVRQNDHADAISISTFGDGDALVLTENFYGTDYYTYLYMYDGSVRELFTNTPEVLGPAAGQSIMACTTFEITQITPELYYFYMEDPDGNITDLYVTARCN